MLIIRQRLQNALDRRVVEVEAEPLAVFTIAGIVSGLDGREPKTRQQ